MQPECEIVAQQQNSLAGLCQRRNSAAGSKRGWRSVKIRPGFPDRFPLSSLPEIFSPDGPLARAIGGYRVRQQQVEMAERIAAAIHSNSVFIAEAGTGTGKTFATIDKALAILVPDFAREHAGNRAALKARYDELVAEHRIRFDRSEGA